MSEPADRSRPDAPPRDIAHRPPDHVFKRDHRSVVWLVRADDAAWVVKRFEHARWRQRLGRLLGLHPAQREMRVNRRLARDRVPVVPIVADGYDSGRAWLVTPAHGTSLQTLIADDTLGSPASRVALAAATIELWDRLRQGGWFFRDFQVANIVVDAQGRPRLIDVGGTRRSRRPAHARRMLRQLLDTARAEGLSGADAWRGARAVARCWPEALEARLADRARNSRGRR